MKPQEFHENNGGLQTRLTRLEYDMTAEHF